MKSLLRKGGGRLIAIIVLFFYTDDHQRISLLSVSISNKSLEYLVVRHSCHYSLLLLIVDILYGQVVNIKVDIHTNQSLR